jgi:hypothetical protein
MNRIVVLPSVQRVERKSQPSQLAHLAAAIAIESMLMA